MRGGKSLSRAGARAEDGPIPGPGGADLSTEEGRATVWEARVSLAEPFEAAFAADAREVFLQQRDAVLAALETEAAGIFPRLQAPGRTLRERMRDEAAAVAALFKEGEWRDEFEAVYGVRVPPAIARLLEEVVAELAATAAVTITVTDPRIRAFVRDRAFRFAKNVNATTTRRLRAALRESLAKGEGPAAFAGRVREVFHEAGDVRAMAIARTETLGAMARAEYEAALSMVEILNAAGKRPKLMWLSARDERVRATHSAVDGQTVELGQTFTVGDCLMLHPLDGETCGLAAEIINCRCVTITVVVDGVVASATTGPVSGGGAAVAVQAELADAGIFEAN